MDNRKIIDKDSLQQINKRDKQFNDYEPAANNQKDVHNSQNNNKENDSPYPPGFKGE